MSYELIDGVDGQQYVVGTLVPDPARLSSMTQPRLSDVMPLLSDDDVMDIVNDPDLPLGRDRWDDSWTFDQGPVGKCATTATKGILMRVRDLQGLERLELSDDYIYVHVNGGRDQGSLLIDVIHQAERGTCPARFVQDGTIKMSGVSPTRGGVVPDQIGTGTENCDLHGDAGQCRLAFYESESTARRRWPISTDQWSRQSLRPLRWIKTS